MRFSRWVGLELSYADLGKLDLFAKVGTFRARLEATASLEGNIEFSNGTGERFRSVKRKPFEVGATGTTGRADTDAGWVGVVARF